MSQGASPRNIDQEKQGPAKMERKRGTEKETGETSDHSREDFTTESELKISRVEEKSVDAQIPTKGEMMEMFLRLENSIKSDINMLRVDLGNLLERVEKTEKRTDKQIQELRNFKEQIKITQQNQKNTD